MSCLVIRASRPADVGHRPRHGVGGWPQGWTLTLGCAFLLRVKAQLQILVRQNYDAVPTCQSSVCPPVPQGWHVMRGSTR